MFGADLVIGFVTSPVTGSVFLTGGLAAPLIGSLGLAIRRSTRRQECARLRDQLVDAARNGELDVTDWRVFSLIDWFDQVATTGRTDIRGRHAPAGTDRRDPAGSLVGSLVTALRPPGTPDLGFEQFYPRCEGPDPGADLRAVAVSYREHHQQRRRHLPRLSLPARIRVEEPQIFEMPSSLVEEIFAVAGSGR